MGAGPSTLPSPLLESGIVDCTFLFCGLEVLGVEQGKEAGDNHDGDTRYKGLGGFPGGAVVGNLPANAGDAGSSPGLERSHMPRSN